MAALNAQLSWANARIIERRTFIELQRDNDDDDLVDAGRRARAMTDSAILSSTFNKDLSDHGSCESTSDGSDTRSVCSDATDDFYMYTSEEESGGKSPVTCFQDFYSLPSTAFQPTTSATQELSCQAKDSSQVPHSQPIHCQSSRQADSLHNPFCPQPVTTPLPAMVAGPMMGYGVLMAPVLMPCFAQSCVPGGCSQQNQQCYTTSNETSAGRDQQHQLRGHSRQASLDSVSSTGGGIIAGSCGSQQPTTLIIRNLPEDVTIGPLLEMLDLHGYCGSYDFVHVPVDFASKTSLRYALINFVNHAWSAKFAQQFHGFKSWSALGKASVDELSVTWSSTLQGLEAHIERYRNSPLMHTSVAKEFQPALFSKGNRASFPSPTTRIKAPRVRCHKSK